MQEGRGEGCRRGGIKDTGRGGVNDAGGGGDRYSEAHNSITTPT